MQAGVETKDYMEEVVDVSVGEIQAFGCSGSSQLPKFDGNWTTLQLALPRKLPRRCIVLHSRILLPSTTSTNQLPVVLRLKQCAWPMASTNFIMIVYCRGSFRGLSWSLRGRSGDVDRLNKTFRFSIFAFSWFQSRYYVRLARAVNGRFVIIKIEYLWSAFQKLDPRLQCSGYFLASCRSRATAFLAVSGPFRVRFGVGVQVQVRGLVGSTVVPWTHQDVITNGQSNPIREQPTPVEVLLNGLK